MILRGIASGEDHAVVAARVDGRWRMLDNRYFLMLEDCDVTKFEPIFAIDAGGAKRFEQPLVAVAANTDSNLSTSAITAPAVEDLWLTHAM